jgi:porphobilinogen synthase
MRVNRTRRLRRSDFLRQLVGENHLTVNDLISPLFVIDGKNNEVAISSMPGQSRFTLDLLLKEIEVQLKLGIKAICLFPALEESLKDPNATEALNDNGLYPRALREIKKQFPELVVMTDVALDPYSSDGHDGLVDASGVILNDETVEILTKMALLQAECGADLIGPSDMMDGRVAAIRSILDENKYINTGIISYTAKYASSFYGPFRDALDSKPKAGDKKSYQMNPANSQEALIEASFDINEGADIIMVKPGLAYLDIISKLKSHFETPIAAYNVSGEYAMIKASAQNGWINENDAILETLIGFKRAGASLILTYFSKDAARLLS